MQDRGQRLPSGCQQGRDEEDGSRPTPLATAPLDHAVTGRTRGMGQRDRARVAQLLWPVLPDRAVESDTPNQCLHSAVGSREVQAATGVQTSRCLVERGHATCPRTVQALGMDERILALPGFLWVLGWPPVATDARFGVALTPGFTPWVGA